MEMVCVFLPAICSAILRDVWKMHAALHTIEELKSLQENVLVIARKLGKAFTLLPSPERWARLGRDSSVCTSAFIPVPSVLAPACQIVPLSSFMRLLSLVILAKIPALVILGSI